jgi:carbamoylphosphate synthase large subunit
MPKRTDIHSILIIGAGPIIIGQACEFDYSGVQACKALRREGYRVVLVNSNPATIMTDPQFADATYVEPLTPEIVEKIIEKERPDALLPTVGGQTGLNLAMRLHASGVLEKHGVQLIGASPDAIDLAEDRQRFKDAMLAAGLGVPEGDTAQTVEEALALAERIGYPVLVRPSFTLGGSGGGVAYSADELREVADRGLRASPVTQVLIEQSVLGWKEYELEVMRDKADNFVVVCSIENLDPMGVHTGDSITVAPAMTLTDRELQRLRNMAKLVMRTVGVETGGSNVQFAVDPRTGRVLIIEMNPRVSRSSALASKATGFPIAKIAALLAVGYTLDEIPNDITRVTPASFEPSLDYVVVKIPRWAFEKFPGVDPTLGPQMKSVGEVMAIGTTFPEAFQKALRGLEIGVSGFVRRKTEDGRRKEMEQSPSSVLRPPSSVLSVPTSARIFAAGDALREGMHVDEVAAATGYDPWFVDQMAGIIAIEREVAQYTLETLPRDVLAEAKQYGFSDAQVASLLQGSGIRGQGSESSSRPPTPDPRPLTEMDVRARRKALGILPVYHRIDTCAAEFEAHTPYLYSTYATRDEAEVTDRPKVIILGGGPNRIGQGIEFDYCCVHACFALKELGYETIMVNCNPETVSTDYDTSDRLYFEPLTLEDVLNIWEHENRGQGSGVRGQGSGSRGQGAGIRDQGAGVRDQGAGVRDQGAEGRGQECASGGQELAESGDDEHSDISRSDRVAEEYGFSGGDIPSGEAISAGGAVRSDEPDQARDRVGSGEYRGGVRANPSQRVSVSPVHSTRLVDGGGDTSADSGTAQLSGATSSETSLGFASGGWATTERSHQVTGRSGADSKDQGGERGIQDSRPLAPDPRSLTPVLVQFGGQTPLNLAKGLAAAGVPIWGTSQDAIDLAEDRGRFGELLRRLEIEQPENGMASDLQTARRVAQRIGFPVLVRPSYVLGGRAMAVAYDDADLARYLSEATAISEGAPVLIDRYLEDAFEVDVDAVGDGERVVIGGVMEHIEEAGVHSGDSAMVMPPYKVSAYHLAIIRDEATRIGLALGVKGLMNVQFGIKDEEVYVLEVNPRASRTVPFIAKATGVPLAKIAAQVAAGKTLVELGLTHEPPLDGFFVKEAVLPFDKFPGAAVMLSPEMRSTGEVMGHAASFGHAFAKAEMGAGQHVPLSGGALLTVNDFDKGAIGRIARDLVRFGFTIYATRGTAAWLANLGIPVESVAKASEGGSGTVELIASGKVQLVVNTPLGQRAYADAQALRSAAIRHRVMLVTTLTGAAATVSAIRALRSKALEVRSLQEHHAHERVTG